MGKQQERSNVNSFLKIGIYWAIASGCAFGRGEIATPVPTRVEVSASNLVLVVSTPAVNIPNEMGLYRLGLTQVDAAKRLQMLLRRATGIEPPIVSATNMPTSGTRCFVGYGSHLEGVATPPTQPEGLKIQFDGRDLYLLGEIAAAGVNNCPVAEDRGVMHAVETFAEAVLGYRFLFSTLDDEAMFELGTVVPKLESLQLARNLLIEDAPVFGHRVCYLVPRNQMGHRSGSASAFFCNHSYGMPWWSAQFGQSHPQMFIPKHPEASPDSDQAVKAMASQPDLAFLDFTETLVLEKRLEQYEKFLADGKAGGFYYDPTIGYLVEEPPDRVAGSVQYNARSRELFDPAHHPWGNFSNIWFDYLNRLSREAKRRWPAMRVATLAYMRHYGLPTFPLDDNIDVMVAMMRTSMGNKEPEVFDKNLADVKAWSAKLGGDRSRMFLWEYGCWPAMWTSVPVICPNAMKRWLQAVRPYVSGVFFETHEPNEYYFIMNRLWMQMLWNPDLDVTAELDDLCRRFFGPAGETMFEFYSRLIERYEMPWTNPKLTWDQYYLDEDLYFRQSYPPDEINRIALLLERAKTEAGLPPLIKKVVATGSAISIAHNGTKRQPVAMTLHALETVVANPSVAWNTGRLTWFGRLEPGDQLEIGADGAASLLTVDGGRREIELVRAGALPEIDPGGLLCFRFGQARNRSKTTFEVELRYGDVGTNEWNEKSANLYARRLLWMADAYQTLPPHHLLGPDPRQPEKKATQRGFFADAHLKHVELGLVEDFADSLDDAEEMHDPVSAAADALVVIAKQEISRAEKAAKDVNETERDAAFAAAREAFTKALEICPDWKIESVNEDNPWAVIEARRERTLLWEKLGEFERMRAEYEAALPAIPILQLDARAYLHMLIGDACAEAGNWIEAESYYLKAQKIGLFGDRKIQIPQKLETVRPLAEEQRKEQRAAE